DSEDTVAAGDTSTMKTQTTTALPKKLIQKTSSSKPVNIPQSTKLSKFSPVVITFDKSGAEKSTAERPRVVKNK
ncbi:MAG: hypothetical protein ABI539_09615, partial [Acidobacteriota bacterium]